VFLKTLRRSLWLGVVLTVSCSSVWPKVPPVKQLPVTVSVHNDVAIPMGVLLKAESEASRIFLESGVELRWLNCSPPSASANPSGCATASFPRNLQLRIVKRSLNLNELTLGISYLSADGTGCYADLFYDRALSLHETNQLSVAAILGHGFAHELGHLLLGTNSHAPVGLMRARWQPADLASASQGRLLFSPLESQQMRYTLASGNTQGKDESRIATARLGN